MSSSFKTSGSVQTEKGLSNLSTASKNVLANFYDWATSKYGISNISRLTTFAERNGIFDSSNELDDFNLLFGIQLNSHEITTFKQSDIDLANNTISLTTLDLSSTSTLQVGDVVNIKFSSGSNGALPSGLSNNTRLFIKTIEQVSSNYKLTFSSSYDGDTFDFTDNGVANYSSDSFAVCYSNANYVFHF